MRPHKSASHNPSWRVGHCKTANSERRIYQRTLYATYGANKLRTMSSTKVGPKYCNRIWLIWLDCTFSPGVACGVLHDLCGNATCTGVGHQAAPSPVVNHVHFVEEQSQRIHRKSELALSIQISIVVGSIAVHIPAKRKPVRTPDSSPETAIRLFAEFHIALAA